MALDHPSGPTGSDPTEDELLTTVDGFPFRFRCRRFGNCCARPGGVVRVTPSDISRIAEHLGMAEQAFRSRYVHPAGDRLRDGLTTECVFLKSECGEAICSIYPVRPEQCQSWPFWNELRDDPEALKGAMRFCPGILAATVRGRG